MNDNTQPIVWHGDLDDDCTARWNGLILRAEWMDGENWWWAVSLDKEMPYDEEIESSNYHDESCKSGDEARARAEQCARKFVGQNQND